jgi:hypothetical protein
MNMFLSMGRWMTNYEAVLNVSVCPVIMDFNIFIWN